MAKISDDFDRYSWNFLELWSMDLELKFLKEFEELGWELKV